MGIATWRVSVHDGLHPKHRMFAGADSYGVYGQVDCFVSLSGWFLLETASLQTHTVFERFPCYIIYHPQSTWFAQFR